MITIRRAGPADAEAVVELRTLMMSEIDPASGQDDSWQETAVEWFRKALSGDEAAAFVVETDQGELVAAAFGEVRPHAPSSNNPSGVSGHLANVVAVPAYRRRGLARACVEQVLTWFREETDASTVELAATEPGRPLYEDLGFTIRPYPTMRLNLG